MALALDYNLDHVKTALKKLKRAPAGINEDLIDTFLNSGKDAAIVGLREGMKPSNKATSLRKVVAKKNLQEKVVVMLCEDEVLLVRKDKVKALGL